jgi:GTP-binding protein
MNEPWKFIKEVYSFSDLPNDEIPEFIFWGRSNVGKSSLINLITKKKIAKTSRTPGRTRSLVLFQYKKHFRIIDLPGYGFSKISKKKIAEIDTTLDKYLRARKNLKKIFILLDSRHLIKPIDQSILDHLNEVTDKEIFLIFTKKDKIKNQSEIKKTNIDIEKIKTKTNKKIFNTSIKESNGIILLKKFLFESLEK